MKYDLSGNLAKDQGGLGGLHDVLLVLIVSLWAVGARAPPMVGRVWRGPLLK